MADISTALRGLKAYIPPALSDEDQTGVLPQGLDPHAQSVVGGVINRNKIIDEMTRNRELQAQFPKQIMSGATPSDIISMQKDVTEDPDTGAAAQGNTADFLAKLRSANLQGFATPQEAAGYQRQQAEANAPSAIENLKGMFGLKQEQARGEWEKGVAHERGMAYEGRTAAMRAKDIADNAAKVAVAQAHNPAISAAVRPLQTELGRIQEGVMRGVYSGDDPQVHQRLTEIQQQLDRYMSGATGMSPAGGGVHPQALALAKQLMQQHPGASLQELLSAAGQPERPQDAETLRQALISAGAQ